MADAAIYSIKPGAIARDVAEAEFDRFCESMELDVDVTRMDANDVKSFEEAKHIVVTAIENGRLVVDERGQPIYTPRGDNAQPITFYEPTGASFLSMDTKKREQEVAKMWGIMGDMTRQHPSVFSKMPQRDLRVCRTIALLFLG